VGAFDRVPAAAAHRATDRTLEHISTTAEARDKFAALPHNKVSGPTGSCAEHFLEAPDEYVKVLIPIINDMIDGNFPETSTFGTIAPTPKNLSRYRPIHLLEIIYRAVDHRVAARLLDAIQVRAAEGFCTAKKVFVSAVFVLESLQCNFLRGPSCSESRETALVAWK
jgi:hypothetical protein